jgi:UDP-N-acetylmuramoylalanine--D-glutamate ligase
VDQNEDVRYYNDSKATNVLAVSNALESFDTPIVLIAGGRGKGEDFRPLRPLVEKRVRALILLGEARGKIRTSLEACCPIEEASSMEEAVGRARALARPGDVVLLSPGCASFDLFRSAEERGRRFKEAVLALRTKGLGIGGGTILV